MKFIELTTVKGNRFMANVTLLQRVFESKEGSVSIIGLDNNGGIEVKEKYSEVVNIIRKTDIPFIELTNMKNNKIFCNVSLIKRVFESKEGSVSIIGLDNNGGIEVKQKYSDIIKML